MALESGTRIGAYEVLAKLGEGGMGEVYRARDTKLDRDVALKVLPDAFTDDPERLARFRREAKLLASLNHPNIAAIFGLEDSGATHALVLELVEGPTLADRIAGGPVRAAGAAATSGSRGAGASGGGAPRALPVDEALPIAKQIAEALEAAHEQGIIHRDLKPANVKVRPDGTVKVLDFGLAKALTDVRSAGASAPAAGSAESPTMSMSAAATRAGFILGTAAYMSPEQAKGRPVDKRSDIWAFGVVLYEMLTGRQAFGGTDIAETLASVLKSDVAWAALPPTTPPVIERLLRRCLEKDQRRRLPDIGVARLDIDEAVHPPEASMGSGSSGAWSRDDRPALAGHRPLWQRPLGLAAGLGVALIVGLAIGTFGLRTTSGPVAAPTTRTSVLLPPSQELTATDRTIAISPSGSHIAYVADRQLYVRPLDELQARPLAGTEDSDPRSPFFSPDGQWVAYFSGQDGWLKKVPVSGGSAVDLAEVPDGTGGSWSADDTIVFSQTRRSGSVIRAGVPGSLFAEPRIGRIAGTGGTLELLVQMDADSHPRQPQVLPGGEAVLYTRSPGYNVWSESQVVAERLSNGERTVIVERGMDARYLPTGHVVYLADGDLFALPFDPARLEATGGAVRLLENVRFDRRTGAMDVDASETGVLVYLPGSGRDEVRSLVWVGRDGTEEALAAPPRAYNFPRISPDGARVAVDVSDQDRDIWVWHFERETLSRLTFGAGDDSFPVWTPDGERIVFTFGQPGAGGNAANLHWMAADGTGEPELLLESPLRQAPHTIAPDGTRLVYYEVGRRSGFDLYSMTLDEERRVEPLVVTEYSERNAEISPDGRWMAYHSDMSGRWEIYVRPFPDVGSGRWQISTTGGTRPLWSRDGTELFYMTADGVMGVTVQDSGPASGLQVGRPRLIVAGAYYGTSETAGANRTYDISPDGQRFLMLRSGAEGRGPDGPTSGGAAQIHVVSNWYQELRARVPVD